MPAIADYQNDTYIEQLAAESNWAVAFPGALQKEYAFMSASNAKLFADRVHELLTRHWVSGDICRNGDRVVVVLHSRKEGSLDHEDLDLAMTVEALRSMCAATRETVEAALD